ncbi:MAG: ferritin [Deltaproteobacteria bacterium]|nr:ferritin [Deltaproteobacteria bacterium]MCL5792072.1 ferritin [Deltaproteobacteria bacterium]
MASKKLLDMLNDAIARELQVSIQYMWQHVIIRGPFADAVGEPIKKIAIQEMQHAEKIAERLDYLGGIPTVKPTPIEISGELKQILAKDIKDEEDAIGLYRDIIKAAIAENDVVTKKLFEDILEDEEDHHNTFTTLAEQ